MGFNGNQTSFLLFIYKYYLYPMRPIIYFLIFVIISLVNFFPAVSQSSDNPRYFILYDVSGSTSYIDKQGHLHKLLLKAIGEDPYHMENINSFEIIFFGEELSSPPKIAFDLPSLNTPTQYSARQTQTLNMINRLSSKEKRHNQYSHIHAAISEIENRTREISGVFIFTDGRLLQDDIDSTLHLSIGQYRSNVAEKLQSIRDSGIPIFLIQTSDKRENPYFTFPSGNVDSRHSLRGKDFFWMYNEIRADSLNKALAIFDQFMSQAHNEIMTYQEVLAISPDDPVSTMVALHQIDVLANELGIRDLTATSVLSTINSATTKNAQTLRNLMSMSSLNLASAELAKSSIDKLTADEAEVSKMLYTLQSNAKANKLFPSKASAVMGEKRASPTETPISVNAASLLTTNVEKELIIGLTNYVIKRTEQEALFYLFEKIDTTMVLMNTYFKDTLFQNTYNFISRYKKHQDILLIKEAFHKDIDEFHDNLILHPRVRESEALVTLALMYEALSGMQSRATLEGTFEEIRELTDKWLKTGPSKTRAEKGIVLMTRLVDFLKQYNLNTQYQNLTPEQIKFLARELIVFYGTAYHDFDEIKLNRIEEHVSLLYKQFHRTRTQLEYLQTSFTTTQTDYNEWQQLRKDILLDVLREVSKLIVSSIKLANEFKKAGETEYELLQKVSMAEDHAEKIIESWFMIREKKYVEAVISLLPVITSVIQANPNLHDYLKGTLADNANKLHQKKKALTKQFVKWDTERIADLDKRFSAARAKIESWNAEDLTLEEFKNRLAQVNLPELEVLIAGDKIPMNVLNALRTFIEATKIPVDAIKLRKLELDYQLAAVFALRYLKFTEMNDNVENLISIAAEVSTAAEADDITNILLKYGLPPASYRVKRQEKTALMINAYSGVGTNFTNNRYINIAAPLGLELSFRSRSRKCSFSLLATPIDLGNAINYELLGDDNATDDDIFRWSNIYSPGGFLIIGLSRNHPFSIGLGYQANPARVSAFVAFDLPILRIR